LNAIWDAEWARNLTEAASERVRQKVSARQPARLRVDRLLGEWGRPVDSEAGREQFARRMEARRQFEAKGDTKLLERGWCMGSEEFRQKLARSCS
jgi:hypothetical protein